MVGPTGRWYTAWTALALVVAAMLAFVLYSCETEPPSRAPASRPPTMPEIRTYQLKYNILG
jgi:hypothetical protein